jgi:hypothetical protein
MRDGAGVSRRASAQARFLDPTGRCHVLQFGNVFLDVTKGHWLSMYRNRFPTGAPPLEMRLMTKARRVGVELADDLPNYSGHSGKFMLKLIAAWIAMGLRRPEITLGKTARGAQ